MSMFISLVLEDEELPESIDGGPGIAKSLASSIGELDEIARQLGLKPLGEFVVDSGEELDEIMADEDLVDIEDLEAAIREIGGAGPWFEPETGLATVGGLIQHFEKSPSSGSEGSLVILRSLETELAYAKDRESRFHLNFAE